MDNKERVKKIVVIGGGTGVFTVLSGLRKFPLDLTAVVTMADDGGSTGVLREEFGILPPGDVRRVLVAMADTDKRFLCELFNYRFKEGGLRGHAFGNIMLTAFERMCGNFEHAVEEAARILGVRGSVLPVTLDNVRLCAELEDGTIIRGETNIDVPKHNARLQITRLFLEPRARINTRVRVSMLKADMIIMGPGDFYTSIIPNLIVQGVSKAIKKSKAKKVYVVNLMTKYGETTGFKAENFVETMERYLGSGVIDYVIMNNKRPSVERMRRYEKENSELVEWSSGFQKNPFVISANLLRDRGFVRHNPEKLANIIVSLLKNGSSFPK